MENSNGSIIRRHFRSMFENRVLPFDQQTYKTQELTNKMIVIADGDLIKTN
jgi:hypothetical protein